MAIDRLASLVVMTLGAFTAAEAFGMPLKSITALGGISGKRLWYLFLGFCFLVFVFRVFLGSTIANTTVTFLVVVNDNLHIIVFLTIIF